MKQMIATMSVVLLSLITLSISTTFFALGNISLESYSVIAAIAVFALLLITVEKIFSDYQNQKYC